ncbi:MAG: RNA methyltransferase [Nitrospira sp. WS238]|nr:RNA methyltransferase [Nitrospira sp. WS238]
MFGGLCFMLNGHMCCGIDKSRLMVRVVLERYEVLLKRPHASVRDITGKPLRGFLFVSPAGCRTTSSLATWLDKAVKYAKSKPPKKRKAKGVAVPDQEATRRKKFHVAIVEANRRYGRALKKLAE